MNFSFGNVIQPPDYVGHGSWTQEKPGGYSEGEHRSDGGIVFDEIVNFAGKEDIAMITFNESFVGVFNKTQASLTEGIADAMGTTAQKLKILDDHHPEYNTTDSRELTGADGGLTLYTTDVPVMQIRPLAARCLLRVSGATRTHKEMVCAIVNRRGLKFDELAGRIYEIVKKNDYPHKITVNDDPGNVERDRHSLENYMAQRKNRVRGRTRGRRSKKTWRPKRR